MKGMTQAQAVEAARNEKHNSEMAIQRLTEKCEREGWTPEAHARVDMHRRRIAQMNQTIQAFHRPAMVLR